jgi:5-methylcytosine-specific restriction enzyme A
VTVLRACVTCGRPSRESYCTKHKPEPWAGGRRRKLMGISGGKWETLRRKVLARDMGICYLCNQFGAEQVDHLVEVADGGTNNLTNLASCHAPCDERKHRDPEWARERVERALAVLGKWGAAETRRARA